MTFRQVCEKTANDLNLPIYMVERALRHWFKFTHDTIDSGEMKGIMMPNLGKYLVKPSRIELLKKKLLNGKTLHIQNNKDDNEGT